MSKGPVPDKDPGRCAVLREEDKCDSSLWSHSTRPQVVRRASFYNVIFSDYTDGKIIIEVIDKYKEIITTHILFLRIRNNSHCGVISILEPGPFP